VAGAVSATLLVSLFPAKFPAALRNFPNRRLPRRSLSPALPPDHDGRVLASVNSDTEAHMTSLAGRATRLLVGIGLSIAAASSLAFAAGQDPKPTSDEHAQVTPYVGSDLFRNYCAVCHGTSARGDGPLADKLKKRPPDLTQFSIQHGGTYPAEMVSRIIDGRRPVPGHGGADMPVWGEAFKASQTGGSEEAAKARIDELVRYLESLQATRGE
jgi:mono/diheme cytochrome c family protein